MPRPAPARPRRGRQRPRYEPDDFEDWDDGGWDGDDDWGFDDDEEPYRRPRRNRHHRAESWETGDADYI